MGSLPLGLTSPKSHAGHSVGSFAAAEPGLDYAGDVIDPGHGDGGAGFKDDDGVRVRGGDGADEARLIVRQ